MTEAVEDIESGAASRVRLNTDYEVEPVPSFEDAYKSNASSSLSPSPVEHTIVPRITTLGYMWRQHIQSRTNNTTLQAVLDRLFLVFVYLSSLMQGPLNFLLGHHDGTNTQRPKSVQPLVTRGMVKTRLGGVGYIISGGSRPALAPILCFHSSPRSSDEFRDVIPLLAAMGRRVVALDVPGYGISENPRQSCFLDDIADAFLQVADSLLIEQFVCIGSLSMGNFIASSLASRVPNRVLACIHANLFYHPSSSTKKDDRAKPAVEFGVPISDYFELKEDGSYLIELHNKRKWLDPELNLRVIQSEIEYLVNHRAQHALGVSIKDQADYDFEGAARKIRCPTLCIGGEMALAYFDAKGMGGTQRFDTACRLIPHCEVSTLTGPRSTINMINQSPQEFASLCTTFLEKRKI
jgi:pimeloyl-ACP methyl ester carboxylesterase